MKHYRRRLVALIFALAGMTAATVGATHRLQVSDPALSDGLKIWRKPGAINDHAACATCHSPDGIEIAAYNFDDDDIIRRALPHLSIADARQLVEYFHALRDKLGLKALRDPNNDRPLQPGGKVLAGKTAAERDLAFGIELKRKLPLLFGARIETIEAAKAAERQLLQLDVTNLPVGIPLNRLSEDVVHGMEHASIAQWLPEVQPTIPESARPGWYQAEDRYLADPSPENLRTLVVQHNQLVDTSRKLGLAALSAAKFRALLVWQDRLRHGTEKQAVNVAPEVLALHYNPIWEVGEPARQLMDRSPQALGMDRETQDKKVLVGPFIDQMRQLRLSWFWAGWLSDQGLNRTSPEPNVRFGLWLAQSLYTDGPYPIHNLFANARRQAVVSNVPEAWGEATWRRRRIWDMAAWRLIGMLPKDFPRQPDARKLYIQFADNCVWMNLLLLKEDLARTGIVWVKMNTRGNVAQLVKFLKIYDAAHATQASGLEGELDALVDRCKEMR